MSHFSKLLPHLRRLHPISRRHIYAAAFSPPPPTIASPIHQFSPAATHLGFHPTRSFCSRSPDDYDLVEELFRNESGNTEMISTDSGIVEKTTSLGEASIGEESLLPVQALISMLDEFHDITGLPWWMVIVSSTLAFRVTMLPLIIFQLQRLKIIGELAPKLPPPFPPPLSGRRYVEQLFLFRKERRAIGCPSFMWLLAPTIQIPIFMLWVTSIRRMSLDHHSGFDCGGALWFHDLTQFPHGLSAPIFPLLIASLHYINVQISFKRNPVRESSDLFGMLLKLYKRYLDFLTLPLLFISFYLPQGSLVYWVTNSSLTAIQQLSIQHPFVREKLGLPDKKTPAASPSSAVTESPEMTLINSPAKQRMVSAESLSPPELLNYSVYLLSKQQRERAISLLQLALDKDPEFAGALILLGQIQLQKGLLLEAIEYFEHAISKLLNAGPAMEVEDVDHLILASIGAGTTCIHQGKRAEGLVHLERIANMEEPEDSKAKAHYFDGLLMFSSALCNEGRRDEAGKLLRRLVAHDPSYSKFLKQFEEDGNEFGSDLVNSERARY